jgi:cell division septation protein DedD
MTADGEWRFTPFETVDVDADSFGLLELEMTPIASEPAPFRPVTPLPASPYMPPPPPLSRPLTTPAQPSRPPCCSVACWILIVLLLLVVGGYVFRRPIVNYIETSYYTPEQLAYLRGEPAQAGKPVTAPPPTPVSTPAPAPAARPETAIKPKPAPQRPAPRTAPDGERTRPTNRFHIFLARFAEESEADDYAQRLAGIGFSAKALHTGYNTYKVSVLNYASQQQAEDILTGLKDTDNSEFRNAWVEKY